jgi:hypothetical protein
MVNVNRGRPAVFGAGTLTVGEWRPMKAAKRAALIAFESLASKARAATDGHQNLDVCFDFESTVYRYDSYGCSTVRVTTSQ